MRQSPGPSGGLPRSRQQVGLYDRPPLGESGPRCCTNMVMTDGYDTLGLAIQG
jgi:hypothetical protein